MGWSDAEYDNWKMSGPEDEEDFLGEDRCEKCDREIDDCQCEEE